MPPPLRTKLARRARPAVAALLRVELDGVHVVTPRGARELGVVVGRGRRHFRRRLRVVRVAEVEAGPAGDAGEQRRVASGMDLVPADVRDLHAVPEANDLALEDAEPRAADPRWEDSKSTWNPRQIPR